MRNVLGAIALVCAVMAALFVAQHFREQRTGTDDPYAGRTPADMSGYSTLAESSGGASDSAAGQVDASCFVDTDVKEIARLKDRGETFVFIAAYAECGFCNRLMPYLAQVANEKGWKVGYLNTRKDPSWQSNVDIDDYDLFVDMFDFYLTKEEKGYHLYTPDLYFIKNGGVVANHQGVTEGADDPEKELTSTQEEALLKTLREEFEKLE